MASGKGQDKQKQLEFCKSSDDDEKCTQSMVLYMTVNECIRRKEENKTLLNDILHLWYFVAHGDKRGINKWARYLEITRSCNSNTVLLILLSRMEYARFYGSTSKVIILLNQIEVTLKQTNTCNFLSVWYLVARAWAKFKQGHGSTDMYAEAAQLSMSLSVFDPTTKGSTAAAYYYSIPSVDADGCVSIPSQTNMRFADAYQEKTCEQRLMLLENIDSDSWQVDEAASIYLVRGLIRLLFTLLRSCPGKGFKYFDRYYFPHENRQKVEQCIEKIKSLDKYLSEGDKVNLHLGECDLNLRQASFLPLDNVCRELYDKAMVKLHHIREAIECGQRIFGLGTCSSVLRMQYIEAKVRNISNHTMSNKHVDNCAQTYEMDLREDDCVQTMPKEPEQ